MTTAPAHAIQWGVRYTDGTVDSCRDEPTARRVLRGFTEHGPRQPVVYATAVVVDRGHGWEHRIGWPVIRDDTAPHQIRIIAPASYDSGSRHVLSVSCTCRATDHGGHTPEWKPIASIATVDEAWTAWRDHHKETNP